MKKKYEKPEIERLKDLIKLGLKTTAQDDAEYVEGSNIGEEDDTPLCDWYPRAM